MKNNDGIINFLYFGHNYLPNFISKVWSDNQNIADHLQSKFNAVYDKKGTMAFFSWFMELSPTNKEILTSWITINYKYI